MRKRCVRKVYQLLNPIQHAIEGAAITPKHELDRLRFRELAAIKAFSAGQATEMEWHEMVALMVIARNMARAGIGPEVLPVCQEVNRHLVEAKDRFDRIGKMGLTGPGLQAIRDLYDYHDLQRQSVSRSEYETAIEASIRKVKFGKPETLKELEP